MSNKCSPENQLDKYKAYFNRGYFFIQIKWPNLQEKKCDYCSNDARISWLVKKKLYNHINKVYVCSECKEKIQEMFSFIVGKGLRTLDLPNY